MSQVIEKQANVAAGRDVRTTRWIATIAGLIGFVLSVILTAIPFWRANSITTPRVIPCSAPAESGGVSSCPALTMNILSPVHSATYPSALSMIASSQPLLRASILARMLLR